MSNFTPETRESLNAVILDRDGTIIVDRHYLSEPEGVELIPGAGEGLRQLQDLGLKLVVITNQSGIGRGFFDEARLTAIHQRMRDLLEAEGVFLDGIYVCPHRPEEPCSCRKPRPGLLYRAAADIGCAPESCIVIGDKATDIELGRQVGAATILVRTGYGAQTAQDMPEPADVIVDDIQAASHLILLNLSKMT